MSEVVGMAIPHANCRCLLTQVGSRFPLDTAGGSYEPLAIRVFNLLIQSPQRVVEPEKPEHSHISWSPPKQTGPVGDTFALGVSVDKDI